MSISLPNNWQDALRNLEIKNAILTVALERDPFPLGLDDLLEEFENLSAGRAATAVHALADHGLLRVATENRFAITERGKQFLLARMARAIMSAEHGATDVVVEMRRSKSAAAMETETGGDTAASDDSAPGVAPDVAPTTEPKTERRSSRKQTAHQAAGSSQTNAAAQRRNTPAFPRSVFASQRSRDAQSDSLTNAATLRERIAGAVSWLALFGLLMWIYFELLLEVSR